MNVRVFLIYFIAINLIILGIDKFYQFIPAACTLLEDAPKNLLYTLGVIEIVLGCVLFTRKMVRPILVVTILFMAWAIIMHIREGTTDIGGAVFLAVVSGATIFSKDKKLTS